MRDVDSVGRSVTVRFGQDLDSLSSTPARWKHRGTIAAVSSTLEDQCACKISQRRVFDGWLYTEHNGLKLTKDQTRDQTSYSQYILIRMCLASIPRL